MLPSRCTHSPSSKLAPVNSPSPAFNSGNRFKRIRNILEENKIHSMTCFSLFLTSMAVLTWLVIAFQDDLNGSVWFSFRFSVISKRNPRHGGDGSIFTRTNRLKHMSFQAVVSVLVIWHLKTCVYSSGNDPASRLQRLQMSMALPPSVVQLSFGENAWCHRTPVRPPRGSPITSTTVQQRCRSENAGVANQFAKSVSWDRM